MSKIPLFSILALALSLTAGRTQSPKPNEGGDLFKVIEPGAGDFLNTKPLTLQDEKPPVPKEKSGSTTEITADNAEFNNKTHIAIFNGKVIVVNPDFNVTCEKLTAYLKHDEKVAEKPAVAPDAKPKPAADATSVPAVAAAKSKGGLEKAIAEMPNGGRVIITQDKKEADGSTTNSVGKADKAVYNATTGDITMTGNPEIRQGISKVVPAEEGVTLIINRDGRYRAIGRTKTLLQDNNEKPAKQ